MALREHFLEDGSRREIHRGLRTWEEVEDYLTLAQLDEDEEAGHFDGEDALGDPSWDDYDDFCYMVDWRDPFYDLSYELC